MGREEEVRREEMEREGIRLRHKSMSPAEFEILKPICVGGKERYQCKHCPKSFSEKGNWKTHFKVIHQGRRYTCNTCNKSFGYFFSLTQHMTFHTGEKPFVCKTCKTSFARSVYLTRHMRIHTGAYSTKVRSE